MPPLATTTGIWTDIPAWSVSNARPATDYTRSPISRMDQLAHAKAALEGKVVRANTESEQKIGIVTQVINWEEYNLGTVNPEGKIMMVLRTRAGNVRTAWIRDGGDLIEFTDGTFYKGVGG